MATSRKQRRANRLNAQKSTGPKTEEGKATSSQNAVKHGLYAQKIIIDSPYLKEDPEQYKQLVESLVDELKPESTIQQYVVLNIANCLWRSRRAIAAETAQIQYQLEKIDDLIKWKIYFSKKASEQGESQSTITPEELKEMVSTIVGQRSIPSRDSNLNILHYQMRLDRQLTLAYQLLTHLKKNRKRNRRNKKRGETANFSQKNTENEPISTAGRDTSGSE